MIKFMSYQHHTQDFSGTTNSYYNRYIFEMELNQDQHLQETLGGNLWYNANLSGIFLPEESNNQGGEGGSSAPDDDDLGGFGLGDVNQDGNFNVIDVVLLVAYILGDTTLSDHQSVLADVNSDNIIDIADVVLMINMFGFS